MKKFYATFLSLSLAALSVAAENPEEIYLVGSFNNWQTPDSDSAPLVMTNEGDGIYTYTLEDASQGIDFKFFTARTGWGEPDTYWGAVSGAQLMYKGIPARWNVVRGYDGSNFTVSNSASVTGPVKLTLDWNALTMTAESDFAPVLSSEYHFELNGDPESASRYTLASVPEENPYVFTGQWEIPAGPFSGWLADSSGAQLGTTVPDDVYLWNDGQHVFTACSAQNGGVNSFRINNWKGGTLNVSLDLSANTFTVSSATQPERPSRVYVVTEPLADGTWNPADCPFRLERNPESGHYLGTVTIPADGFGFKFGVEGLDHLIGTNDEAHEIFNNAQTLYFLSGSASATPLACSNWAGGEITFDLSADFNYVNVTAAPGQPLKELEIYLVGQPQGWNIIGSDMPLVSVDNGINYYGKHEINAGQTVFRFYTHLGNWDMSSIGSQYDDQPVDVEMTEGRYAGNCVYGKGSWNFPSWPGGVMYMHVNMLDMTVEFSDHDLAGAALVEADRTVVKAFRGGIRVESAPDAVDVFDLQGRRVASLRAGQSAALPAGVYICGGQKLLVM